MHAKSGGSCGEPPDFLFIPAACRSRKEPPRSVGGGDRARNAGYRLRNAEDGGTGTGRGVRGHGHRAQGSGAAGAGAGAGRGTRKTRAWGAGRKTRNAEHVKRGRGHGHGARETGDGRRETGDGRRGTGDGAQAPVHGPQRDCIHPPGPATTCRDRSQPGAIRRGPHPTCRAYESESRRCRRARRTCCCRAAPRPT